jgi:3-isopropylmalate/(R)-2-methylmalate dehydratase large subunit
MNIPESLKFNFDGFLPEYVSGKDVILRVIGDIGTDGADFKSMEFEGDAISALSLEERATICNMAIEAGGNGIIAPDEATRAYVERFGSAWLMKNSDRIEELFSLQSDDDAKYLKVLNYDAEKLEPMVALPHSPGNVKPVRECEGARMDSVYIGSCTGGKSEDFLMAAQILVNGGREVKVPLYIVPATNKVVHYIENKKIGDRTLKEIFENAGANMDSFYQPSCAACLGGPIDTYGRINNQPNHFRASTTNRNFPKRMGSGNIFLVSPMTAAATAMKGTLCDPRVYVR